MSRRRSGCPINLTLENFGDRWSLIVLRDIMFGRHRTFRSLLAQNIEAIASNILADRLKRLTENGLLSRCGDAGHKQRVIYSLTEKAIELVPLMAVMGSWGLRYTSRIKGAVGTRPNSRGRRPAALERLHGRAAASPSGSATAGAVGAGSHAVGL